MHLLMGSVSTLDKKYSRMFEIIFCVFLYFLYLMHFLMEGVSSPEKTEAEYGNVSQSWWLFYVQKSSCLWKQSNKSGQNIIK